MQTEKHESLASDLPAGSSLPPERQTARLAMRPLAFMEELRARFGDVFTVRLMHETPWVMVSDPELIKQVYKAPSDVLHGGEGKEVLRPVLGDYSVLLLDEEAHMEQRRLLLPPFGGSRVAAYEATMRDAAAQAAEEWPLGATTEATDWMRRVTLEVILRVVFGVDDSERFNGLRKALSNLRRPGNPGESRDPAFHDAIERMDALIFAEIAKRRTGRGNSEHPDVFSLLLDAHHEDGSPMSAQEIRDELISLLMAGYETTTTALAWALELLARHPAALAAVAEEAADGGGPYTDAAIRETLRLRPVVPVVARAVKMPFDLGPYRIRAGVTIVPAILLLHHRPDIYPEPAAFRPERFLDAQPDPHTWMPFGGGSRRCLGARFAMLEMRVVLSTLLARKRLRPADPKAESMRCRNVTLTPSRGGSVVLEPR